MPRRKRNARPIHGGEQKKGRHRLDRHTFDPFTYLRVWGDEGDEAAGAGAPLKRSRPAPAATADSPSQP